MTKKKAPSNLFAPVVIAGITLGFLASAYKFIFAKTQNSKLKTQNSKLKTQNSKLKTNPARALMIRAIPGKLRPKSMMLYK
ncbi:hypothetical protein HXZ61_05605 [Acinetobacter indicus]|uniref:hypothetical protein n=1 Tax=Acinetobacter indicus TaxID=756892 RepID=UPI0025753A48|nr:hypothetical protein [Acinetobacter indicus]MDM1269683.1 hypothetical protein [Acinetobacter indicus]